MWDDARLKKKKQTLNYFQKKKNEVEIYSLTLLTFVPLAAALVKGEKKGYVFSLSLSFLSLSLFSLFVRSFVRSFLRARRACVCVQGASARFLLFALFFHSFLNKNKSKKKTFVFRLSLSLSLARARAEKSERKRARARARVRV